MFFGPCWTHRTVVYQCITVPSLDQIPWTFRNSVLHKRDVPWFLFAERNLKKKHDKLWVTVNVSKDNCWHVLYFGWRRQGTRPSHGKEPRYLFSRALFVFLMGFKSESLWMPVIFNCSLHEVHMTYCMLYCAHWCTLYVIFMFIFVDIHPFFVQLTCKTSFLAAQIPN